MFTLYGAPNTGAFAVEAALELAQAEYEFVTVNTRKGEHRAADYVEINPRGQVPALRLADGSIMSESAAMLMHLADVFPEAALLPPAATAGRAQAYRWLTFLAANVYEADLRYYYSERYTGENGNPAAVREAALAQMDRDLAIVAGEMKDRVSLLEGGWSVCDLYLTMLCRWHPDQDRLFADHPALQACVETTLANPAVDRAARRHPEILGKN